MTQPTKSSKLRNAKHGGSAFAKALKCPSCGGTRPERSLILCRVCWSELPQHQRLLAYKMAKENPTTVRVGEIAAQIISAVSVPKGLDEVEAA